MLLFGNVLYRSTAFGESNFYEAELPLLLEKQIFLLFLTILFHFLGFYALSLSFFT